VAADAAAILAGRALDPEALVADGEAELVDRLTWTGMYGGTFASQLPSA
jgi:hypothetical protein